MADFQLMSEKLGLVDKVPGILLPEAFVTAESRNVREVDGEYRGVPGKLPEILDDGGVKITAPINVFAITAVDTATEKFTISGLHKTTIETNAVSNTIRIIGSTGNDKLYTISSITEVGGTDTEVIVDEDVTDATGDGNMFVGATPILTHHLHNESNASETERLLLATKYHILLWDVAGKELVVKFTSGTPANVERWEIVSHLRNVYATNNVDVVQWWNVDDSVSNSFAALDNASGIDVDGVPTRLTAAKHITSHERYLFLGYVTIGGTVFPRQINVSSRSTPDDFDVNGSGDAFAKSFENDNKTMMGFARKGDFIYVGKRTTVHRGWLVTSDEVFKWEEEPVKVGWLSADAVVNDPAGRLYFLASDFTIREIDTLLPISEPLKNTTLKINPATVEFAGAQYMSEMSEIWFTVPIEDSATNNLVIAVAVDTGKMFLYDFAIRSFGRFTRQEVFGYDTLPYATYEEWGTAWVLYDTKTNVVGFGRDLGSDYSGNTFVLHEALNDDGAAFDRTLVISTTLTDGKQFNQFKRVNNGIDFYYNAQASGSVAVSVKRDSRDSFDALGSVSLIRAGFEQAIPHLTTDFRAKQIFLKQVTSNVFEFLGLLVTEYEFDGTK